MNQSVTQCKHASSIAKLSPYDNKHAERSHDASVRMASGAKSYENRGHAQGFGGGDQDSPGQDAQQG